MATTTPVPTTELRADAERTRQRLLDAAGEIFAEQGFAKATVRDICARADANIAAASYHFGGKLQLYEAAIEHYFQLAIKLFPIEAPSEGQTPRERLHAFIHSFMMRLLGTGKPAWHAQLVAREMVEPTGVLDRMILRWVQPTLSQLEKIVREIVGPARDQNEVDRAVMSVIGQCVFYNHCRPVIQRVYAKFFTLPVDVDAIAEHVTRFSFAGLSEMAK